MDRLEKYILDNRTELEESRDPVKGWSRLAKRMHTPERDWSLWWKVAAVIFFISTGLLSISKFYDKDPVPIATTVNPDGIEQFFVKMIDYKRAEYLELASEADSEELLKDIAQLDSAYFKLKVSYEELEDQELLEAMLENLRLRVYILSEQIELLKNGEEESEEIYHSS